MALEAIAIQVEQAAIEQPAPVSGGISQEQADHALSSLQAVLPGTVFVRAWPAALPGFIAVELEDGSVGYTDKSGRYLLLGIVFDTVTGDALDNQLDGVAE